MMISCLEEESYTDDVNIFGDPPLELLKATKDADIKVHSFSKRIEEA